MRRLPLANVFLAMALTACASGGGGGGGEESDRRSGGDPNRLTAEELASVSASNVYDAVQALRPRWFRARSANVNDLPAAFVDGRHRGDYRDLAQVPLSNVESIQYLSARDATTLYGTGYPGGAIDVRTR